MQVVSSIGYGINILSNYVCMQLQLHSSYSPVDPKDELILPKPSMGSGSGCYSSAPYHSPSPLAANMERQTVITDAREAYSQHYNKGQ